MVALPLRFSVAVASNVPVGEPTRTSILLLVAVLAVAARKVIWVMFFRLIGKNEIQSLLLMLVIIWPAPPSVVLALVTPDMLV